MSMKTNKNVKVVKRIREPGSSGQKKVQVNMLMHPKLKASLEAIAEPRGIGYQTLAQELLGDAVADILNWKRADALSRFALVGHDLRKYYEQLAGALIDVPEPSKSKAEEAVQDLRKAVEAILRLIGTTEDEE